MSGITRGVVIGVVAMAVIVTASNVLVQYPVGDFLTWGAFTYPFAFLVTDLMNRRLGPGAARKVAMFGFAAAVVLSYMLATPRIAIASGTAFLLAQLLDIAVFHRLRSGVWWRAPFVSSMIGGALDTTIFFTLAFAASFVFLGPNEDWAIGLAPLMGVGAEAPFWVSLAIGDFCVKMLIAVVALVPFRLLLGVIGSAPARTNG